MNERQLRAWRALELGPVWLARAGEGLAPADGDDRSESLPIEPQPVSPPAPRTEPWTDPAGASSRPGPPPAAEAAAAEVPLATEPKPALPVGGVAATAGAEIATMDWPRLRSAVGACEACALSRTRTNTVFGVGPEAARWLVIGEGPGADEDASGEPFVGQAGKLLDAMLASIGLDRRRNVFIANVVKCRPPRNRTPQQEETAACLPYLRRQIALLAPDIVILLGRTAANGVLGNEESVGRLRGRVHELRIEQRRIPAVVTWHPSYLLRKPDEKALAWADLCLAVERFEALRRDAEG